MQRFIVGLFAIGVTVATIFALVTVYNKGVEAGYQQAATTGVCHK